MTTSPDPLARQGGPACWLAGCSATPAVQWRRRHSSDGNDIEAVFACSAHAISLDGAAHIHQPQCAADPARLPVCGCTPEPLPAPTTPLTPPVPAATAGFPPGWATPPKTT